MIPCPGECFQLQTAERHSRYSAFTEPSRYPHILIKVATYVQIETQMLTHYFRMRMTITAPLVEVMGSWFVVMAVPEHFTTNVLIRRCARKHCQTRGFVMSAIVKLTLPWSTMRVAASAFCLRSSTERTPVRSTCRSTFESFSRMSRQERRESTRNPLNQRQSKLI